MPLQDLTAPTRTLRPHAERGVGCFLLGAFALVVVSLGFYVYKVKEEQGWFKNRAVYFAFVESADGIQEGDAVKLMGFDVGQITHIDAQPADDQYYNVYVEFEVFEPYYGYVWSDSVARVLARDLLGNRYLELTKGVHGQASYIEDATTGKLIEVWHEGQGEYIPVEEAETPYWIQTKEDPALNDRLDQLVLQVEAALPKLLVLTNQITSAVTNANRLFATAEGAIADARPLIQNLASISDNLRDPNGSLGRWAIPPELGGPAQDTIMGAGQAIQTLELSAFQVASNLNRALIELHGVSSNLNAQAARNTNLLSDVTATITNAHRLIEGLKDHWILRSAFRESGGMKPYRPPKRLRSR